MKSVTEMNKNRAIAMKSFQDVVVDKTTDDALVMHLLEKVTKAEKSATQEVIELLKKHRKNLFSEVTEKKSKVKKEKIANSGNELAEMVASVIAIQELYFRDMSVVKVQDTMEGLCALGLFAIDKTEDGINYYRLTEKPIINIRE